MVNDDEHRKIVARVNAAWAFWVNVVLLVVFTTFDFLMLGHYGSAQRETFGPLAKTMRRVGIHGAVWMCRAVVYPVLFVLICLPRCRTVNSFLLTLNMLYLTALGDYLYATGLISGPADE